MIDPPISSRDLLFTLLLKVGVGRFVCGAAGALEHSSGKCCSRKCAIRPKVETDAVHDAAADFGVVVAPGAASRIAFADLMLEGAFLMGLLGGRVVGPIGGSIITPSSVAAPRVAVHARGRDCGSAGWVDSPGYTEQGGDLEFWAVHVLEHTALIWCDCARRVKTPWEMLPLLACLCGLELARVALVQGDEAAMAVL